MDLQPISMSLDEIIKSKKQQQLAPRSRSNGAGAGAGPRKHSASLPLKTKRLGTDSSRSSRPLTSSSSSAAAADHHRHHSPTSTSPARIVDARNKIIQRTRSKITDARDKLAEITKQSGDIRHKLLRKQQQKLRAGTKPYGLVSGSAARNAAIVAAGYLPLPNAVSAASRHPRSAVAPLSLLPRHPPHHAPHRHPQHMQHLHQHRQHHLPQRHALRHQLDLELDADEDMDMEDLDDAGIAMADFLPAAYALRRTVHQDINQMPPLPQFSRASAEQRSQRAAAAAASAAANSASAAAGYRARHHSAGGHHLLELPQQLVHRQQSPPMASAAVRGGGAWPAGPDPFDCYEVPMQRPIDVSEPKHLQRHIRGGGGGGHPDLIPTKGILRYGGQHSPPPPQMLGGRGGGGGGYRDGYADAEPLSLSYEMRTRLERAPDAGASAGSFSNPYTLVNNHHHQQQQHHHGSSSSSSAAIGSVKAASSKSSSASASASIGGGYRIVVSNLHSSVSQSDIRELFEDIGELQEARLVRPGVAEVIFRTMKDAEMAVDTYHNRQLDGQPMKCLLVQPRPQSGRPTAPAVKSGGGGSAARSTSHSTSSSSGSAQKSSKTPLEIDIDALHKVLFQPKSYSRH